MSDDWNNLKKLGDFVHSKRVCLIGGADGTINARYMHHADVVARVNLHYQRQGGKTDIIFAGPGLLPSDTINAKFLIHPGNNGAAYAWHDAAKKCGANAIRYMPIQTLGVSAYGCDHDWLNAFMKELGSLPLTGILATKLLSMLPLKELRITGMDLYAKDGVLPYQVGSHRLFTQADWLRKQTELDARIILDDRLKEVSSLDFPRETVEERANWYNVEDASHELR